MLQFIIRLLIFSVAISLSLLIGVQWKLNEDLKYLSSNHRYDFDFSYDSSVITPLGQIILKDVKIYSQKLDVEITINEIQYSSGSIFKMAFLRQEFESGEFPELLELKIDQAVIPLSPSLVKAIKAFEKESVWGHLNASACGNVKSIGINQYFSMGYDYLVLSAETSLYKDPLSRNLHGKGWLEIEETSEIQFRLNLTDFYNNQLTHLLDTRFSQIEMFDLTVKDAGYNYHKNEYCSGRSQLSTADYLKQHVKIIQQKLRSVGIKMTPSGQRDYSDFLKPNSELHLHMEPDANFTAVDFSYYNEIELRKRLNLKLEVNDKNVPLFFNDWDLKKFQNISLKDKKAATSSTKIKRYKTILIKRQFQLEKLSDVEKYIDYKVKLLRVNGKETIGKLKRVYKKRLYIAMNVQKGTVEIPVLIKDIKTFSVFR